MIIIIIIVVVIIIIIIIIAKYNSEEGNLADDIKPFVAE